MAKKTTATQRPAPPTDAGSVSQPEARTAEPQQKLLAEPAELRGERERHARETRAPLNFLAGCEMGERTRSFDWSKTPVGPVAGWPQSLKTAVSICLGSRYPIVIWWGNPAYTMFYNDAYISFLGVTKHPGWLGRSGRECWREIWPTIGPMLESVFATGEATWSEDLLLILERNIPQEEGYFTFSYSAILDDASKVGGIFCACYETTGRVLGERRLRSLRDLGRTVAETKTAADACAVAAQTLAANPADIPFALIYLLEGDGRRAKLAGLTAVGWDTPASPAAVDLEGADAPWPFRQVVETGRAVEVTVLPDKFGPLPGGAWPESPQRAVVLPMAKPGQTQLAGFVVAGVSSRLAFNDEYKSFMDLLAGHVATAVANARAYEEERKRAEALAEIDRAKTTFFSNVSHELRTPLTLMLGPLEDAMHENPKGADLLQVAHRNSLRLLKLVNTLLDFSRIEAGRIQASYEPTDLAAYTAELASVFRSAVEKAGLRLTVDCPPLPEPAYVDREMWEKIVLNLLSNAFKFTFEGEIKVSLRWCGDRVELSVSDTGIGIPEAELSKIFERFHRVRDARSRTHEGTGIGLALAQQLAALHGGQVKVQSKEGEGATFVVSVQTGAAHLPQDRICASRQQTSTAIGATPFVEEALLWLPSVKDTPDTRISEVIYDAEASDQPPLPGVNPADAVRILLVDDNADMRDYLGRLLGKHFQVQAVADGQAALQLIQANPPDLVLADVMMPRLDGFGLLRAIRAVERTRTIPVILLSARAGEEARVEGLDAGAADYLIKPFSARELLARVRSQLALSRLRRESEKHFRDTNAELAQYVMELQDANSEIQNSRRAALNLMEDAVQSRQAMETLNVELRESEERFRTLFASAPMAVFVCDLNAVIQQYNQRALELWGREPECGIEHHCGSVKLWLPDGTLLPHAQSPIVEVLRTGVPARNVEVFIERPDGSRLPVLVNFSTLKNTKGEITGAITSFMDITERKMAEVMVESQRQALQLLAEGAPLDEVLGFLIGVVERHSAEGMLASIVPLNEAGTHFQRGIGASLPDAFNAAVEGVAVSSPSGLCANAVRRREAVAVRDFNEDAAWQPFGKVVAPYGLRSGWSIPSISSSGHMLGTFANYYRHTGDPTPQNRKLVDMVVRTAAIAMERKRAEETLRESEERFRSLVSVITDVSWVTDAAGAFIAPQPEWQAYTGQTWDKHGGFGWANALHPEDRDRVKGIWLRACETHTVYESRGRVWHAPTQQWRHYVARATPLFHPDGSVREWVGTCTDIHELKQTEEALRRLNDELEARVEDRTRELVASQDRLRALAAELNLAEQRERRRLATELHDYLAQLLAFTKIKLAQAKQQSMAPPMAKALTDMQDVMDQALTYTRTLVAQLSPPLLNQFGLPTALKWLAEQMQQRDLTVSLELESETLPLPEDQAMLLFQSIRELLINVVKHGGTKSARITVRQADGTLHITVSDQGAGFDLAAAAAAAAAAADRTSSLPGFGLFSIRERMLALGGRFDLLSRPGEGTTATLVLPLGNTRVPNSELGMLSSELAEFGIPDNSKLRTQHSALQKNATIRVLLVDDHMMVRQGLRSILDAYQDISVVGEAADGEEAVELSRLLSPDVVVMDVNMPKMDGIEATRRIKQDIPGAIVIGLSIQNVKNVEAAMQEAGAVAFVNKEAAVEDLYQTIQRATKKSWGESPSP